MKYKVKSKGGVHEEHFPEICFFSVSFYLWLNKGDEI